MAILVKTLFLIRILGLGHLGSMSGFKVSNVVLPDIYETFLENYDLLVSEVGIVRDDGAIFCACR